MQLYGLVEHHVAAGDLAAVLQDLVATQLHRVGVGARGGERCWHRHGARLALGVLGDPHDELLYFDLDAVLRSVVGGARPRGEQERRLTHSVAVVGDAAAGDLYLGGGEVDRAGGGIHGHEDDVVDAQELLPRYDDGALYRQVVSQHDLEHQAAAAVDGEVVLAVGP